MNKTNFEWSFRNNYNNNNKTPIHNKFGILGFNKWILSLEDKRCTGSDGIRKFIFSNCIQSILFKYHVQL